VPDQQAVRKQYHEELGRLEAQALGAIDLVVESLDRALECVEHRDVELAAMVIADDDRIDGRFLEVHQSVLRMLALQSPVAGDLRVIAALLHVVKHIERMGDQVVNIAKLVPLAGHEPPVDDELLQIVLRMGQLARSEALQCKQAFSLRDVPLAADLVRQDREINKLNRDAFRRAVISGTDEDRREWSMHMMLMARALERLGDNAVDIGEQVAFVESGRFREFRDASHPGDVAREEL
jgi:phosphate transport system protein